MNTNDTQTLILAGDGYQLTIAPEAEAQKVQLLNDAAAITVVMNAKMSEAARDQVKRLAAMRNLVEKSRKTVKEPVLKVGKDIDAKASDFVRSIDAEEKRLAGLISCYAAEVERERARMIRELQAKREAEERAQREAEALALELERQAKEAARAAAAAEWADDEAETARAAAAAAAREAAALEAAKAAEAARPAPVVELAPAKPSGVRFEWDFEVIDIEALHDAQPGFVKLEVKRAEVLTFLKGLNAEDPQLSKKCAAIGLRVFQKAVVSTR